MRTTFNYCLYGCYCCPKLSEWQCKEAAKRTFNGLGKQSATVVQFDTTKNHFLTAGDKFLIKCWDTDNTNLLTTIDADGGLPAFDQVPAFEDGDLSLFGDDKRSKYDNCEDIEEGMNMGVVMVIRFISKVAFLAVVDLVAAICTLWIDNHK
ncbi:putative transcription factor WD40-like family protein [Tanacetum coccineum]